MPSYIVSVNNWEEPGHYQCENRLEKGEVIVVEGNTGSKDIGIVLKKSEEGENKGKIIRKATKRDIQTADSHTKKRSEYINVCRSEAKRLALEMKLVDAVTNLEGKQVTFIFTAEGRIDFRELVKNLSQIFRKSIRMQQIGSRDEARKLGGYGMCGREFCCVKFPGSLQSISTDMARVQLIDNRGSERISGLCGRLMCCLAFEAEQYRQLLKGFPELGSVQKIKEGEGTVCEVNALTGEYKVKLADGNIITIKKR